MLWPHNQKIRKSSTVVSSSREPWMLTCQQHCGDKGIFGILISVLQPFHPTATISQGVKGQNLTLPSITDAFFLLAEMDSSFPLGWKMVAEGTVISISCMELTRQIQTNSPSRETKARWSDITSLSGENTPCSAPKTCRSCQCLSLAIRAVSREAGRAQSD